MPPYCLTDDEMRAARRRARSRSSHAPDAQRLLRPRWQRWRLLAGRDRGGARRAAARRSRARSSTRHSARPRVSVVVQEVGERAAAVRARARAADESGVDDEARHDVRRRSSCSGPTTAGRPRRMLDGSDRRRRAGRRSDAQGLRRSEDHRRAMAGVHGAAARDRADRRSRRPRRSIAATSRRCRTIPRHSTREPLQALQRRSRRAARQLQERALRVRAERRRQRGRRSRRAGAGRTSPCTARRASSKAIAATGERRCGAAFDDRGDGADVTLRRPLSAQPAASATGTSRCSTIRTTCYGIFARMLARCRRQLRRPVREGRAPRGRAAVRRRCESPPLYDIVRDVNKLSNNVMARQLFLTLGDHARIRRRRPPRKRPTPSSAGLRRASSRFPELVLDNGSGLSRRERISARQPGAAADRRRRERRARRIRELARGRRDRRHRQQAVPERRRSPIRRC